MTTSSTTSTTTSPSVSTSSTTSTTTTPSVSTSSTTSTTTPQPISCPPDGSGFTTVQLEDGNYFTYRVAKMLASQETAIQSCTNHGSFLARVTTVAKMNMLLQLIRTCSGYNSGLYDYYVDGSNAGATDFFAPGAWVMSNGDLVPMSNDFWGDMKPNYPETQHCLRMTADINFMWDDCSCSLEHYFICEK
ncbi:uncharacterized protein LOC123540218 [Mercenaria mercenaria]|uniref:uncharacterized protein LOC123540218 n=1 Tax=Mercenaria mercenaria TaxID=6596 RepID=UPI001E1D3894|nr:uncharacterized protein LOC123540218 [Mercenaria mercenaria]